MFIVIAFFLLQHARAGGCNHRVQVDAPDLVRVATEARETAESLGIDLRDIAEVTTNNMQLTAETVCQTAERLGVDVRAALEQNANASDNMAHAINNLAHTVDVVVTTNTGQICETLVYSTDTLADLGYTAVEAAHRLPNEMKDAALDYSKQLIYHQILPIVAGAFVANMGAFCWGTEFDAINSIGGGACVYIVARGIESHGPKILKCLKDNSTQEKIYQKAILDCQLAFKKEPELFSNGILSIDNFVGSWGLVKDEKRETYTVRKSGGIGVVSDESGQDIGMITTQRDSDINVEKFLLTNLATGDQWEIKYEDKVMIWKRVKGKALPNIMPWVKLQVLENQ